MNTTIASIATISTSVSSLLAVVLQRETWSVQQTPAGVHIAGRTGSGREISGTVFGAKLPFGITRRQGGVVGWDCDPEAHDLEARRVAVAARLCREFSDAEITVTLEWETGRSPYGSTFGVEVLADLGFSPAKTLLERVESHYWDHQLCRSARQQFAALFAPLPEGEDPGDDSPIFAPMWAA